MPKLDPSYPWLCGEGQFSHPSSSNQHEILSLIQAYQTKGYMKKCAHLEIPEAPPIQSRPWDYIHFFRLAVKKRHLISIRMKMATNVFMGVLKAASFIKQFGAAK
ncbi:MAG: hypothetical protein IH977_04385 [Nitrospinae bacterium]|nr:hypothetical protein [Nitrospinota bacterium]